MGIWEKMPDSFLDKLRDEFGFEPPREHGWDTVDSLRAMRDGKVDVFFALGGNFAAATPDTALTEQVLSSLHLTVHVATKLNRSHLCTGREALILPCLGRTERDVQAGGDQRVTVEDSMSMVHASAGRLAPGSDQLRSEVAIVTGLGRALFGDDDLGWREMGDDYRVIRQHIQAVVPGFGVVRAAAHPAGRVPRCRTARGIARSTTPDGKAHVHGQLHRRRSTSRPGTCCCSPSARTTSSTRPYTDTTTGTAASRSGRRVVFVNVDDMRDFWAALTGTSSTWSVGVWHDGENDARSPSGWWSTPRRQRPLRSRLLPRGQRARAARFDGRDEQHAHLEVDRRAARGCGRVTRFLVVGEALIDVIVAADGSRREHVGGSPANVAYGLGRLGDQVSLLTRLGSDRRGERIVAHLDDANVVVLASDGVAPTATATAVLGADGSATYEFCIDWDVDIDLAPRADVLHVGSIGALVLPGADAVRVLATVRRPSTLISFDPNIRPALLGARSSVVTRVEHLVGLADVVKVSSEDLAWLYPSVDPVDALARWARLGGPLVVMTDGAQGVVAFWRGTELVVPAVPVEVVDTVGAGDSFMAGLLDGLSRAVPEDRLRRGQLNSLSRLRLLRRWNGLALLLR